MVFDYSELKILIFQKFGNYSNLCRKIGWARQVLSRKLHGHGGFTRSDILLLCDTLGIMPEEIGKYFFTTKV